MNYEEKYKEALERARDLHDNHALGMPFIYETCEDIFPELRESEDEKIREAIYIYLDWLYGRKDYAPKGKYTIKDMIAWLEKQGEKKSSWNEEDEKFFKTALWHISNSVSNGKDLEGHCATTEWLKSLKDRVQPQLKQELSEEDEKIILSLHHALNCADAQNAVTKTGVEVADVAQWLSDCKERFAKPNHWKPSEEQLIYLKEAINKFDFCDSESAGLQSLYNNLLKL